MKPAMFLWWVFQFGAGMLCGWALRGIWINRKVQKLLDESHYELETVGDLEGARAKLDRADHILSAL